MTYQVTSSIRRLQWHLCKFSYQFCNSQTVGFANLIQQSKTMVLYHYTRRKNLLIGGLAL